MAHGVKVAHLLRREDEIGAISYAVSVIPIGVGTAAGSCEVFRDDWTAFAHARLQAVEGAGRRRLLIGGESEQREDRPGRGQAPAAPAGYRAERRQ